MFAPFLKLPWKDSLAWNSKYPNPCKKILFRLWSNFCNLNEYHSFESSEKRFRREQLHIRVAMICLGSPGNQCSANGSFLWITKLILKFSPLRPWPLRPWPWVQRGRPMQGWYGWISTYGCHRKLPYARWALNYWAAQANHGHPTVGAQLTPRGGPWKLEPGSGQNL